VFQVVSFVYDRFLEDQNNSKSALVVYSSKGVKVVIPLSTKVCFSCLQYVLVSPFFHFGGAADGFYTGVVLVGALKRMSQKLSELPRAPHTLQADWQQRIPDFHVV